MSYAREVILREDPEYECQLFFARLKLQKFLNALRRRGVKTLQDLKKVLDAKDALENAEIPAAAIRQLQSKLREKLEARRVLCDRASEARAPLALPNEADSNPIVIEPDDTAIFTPQNDGGLQMRRWAADQVKRDQQMVEVLSSRPLPRPVPPVQPAQRAPSPPTTPVIDDAPGWAPQAARPSQPDSLWRSAVKYFENRSPAKNVKKFQKQLTVTEAKLSADWSPNGNEQGQIADLETNWTDFTKAIEELEKLGLPRDAMRINRVQPKYVEDLRKLHDEKTRQDVEAAKVAKAKKVAADKAAADKQAAADKAAADKQAAADQAAALKAKADKKPAPQPPPALRPPPSQRPSTMAAPATARPSEQEWAEFSRYLERIKGDAKEAFVSLADGEGSLAFCALPLCHDTPLSTLFV